MDWAQGFESANHDKKKKKEKTLSFDSLWSIYHRYACSCAVCVCVSGAGASLPVCWVISLLNVAPLTSLFKG